jgi:hypothetical protein
MFHLGVGMTSALLNIPMGSVIFTLRVTTICGDSLVATFSRRVLIPNIKKHGSLPSHVRIDFLHVATAGIMTEMAYLIQLIAAAPAPTTMMSGRMIRYVQAEHIRVNFLNALMALIMMATHSQIAMIQAVLGQTMTTRTIQQPYQLHDAKTS